MKLIAVLVTASLFFGGCAPEPDDLPNDPVTTAPTTYPKARLR